MLVISRKARRKLPIGSRGCSVRVGDMTVTVEQYTERAAQIQCRWDAGATTSSNVPLGSALCFSHLGITIKPLNINSHGQLRLGIEAPNEIQIQRDDAKMRRAA